MFIFVPYAALPAQSLRLTPIFTPFSYITRDNETGLLSHCSSSVLWIPFRILKSFFAGSTLLLCH